MTPVRAGSGDPSAYPVQIALLADEERPTDEDWHNATWDTDGGETVAVLLVGPAGAVDPGPGSYRTWVKITAAPEVPVIKSARFQIT
ncbi:hypothetical protein OG784_12845 [Streptomyces sp. NBC_01617]|uniref:hypothetical protein n=1 Tax=Streptomyces sp. NBC_01617 TaxID=2975899 RepID=UPI00386F6B7C|nr:hypothetical protein OG784_12845 [Streptomyces sp. NBC_01617]